MIGFSSRERQRIGEVLIAEGLLTEAVVQRALGLQRASSERTKLGTVLLEWGLLPEEALLDALSRRHGCPGVSWQMLSAAKIETVRLLPATDATRLGAIVYSDERGGLLVAFANPSDLFAVDETSALTRRRVIPGVTTEIRLMQAHQKFYGRHLSGNLRRTLKKLEERTTSRAARVHGSEGPSDTVSPSAVPSEVPPSPATLRVNSEEPTGGDSLAKWFGDALTAFAEAPLADRRSDASGPTAGPTILSGKTQPMRLEQLRRLGTPPGGDPVSRPRPDPEVSRLWTSLDPDAGTSVWDRRFREEIGEAILRRAFQEMPRVILLAVGRRAVAGWRGREEGLAAEWVPALRTPMTERSVFAEVAQSGIPHFGPVPRDQWPRSFERLLGTEPPACAVFPIAVLNRIVALVYADRFGEPMSREDSLAIRRAAESIGRLLLQFARQSPPRSQDQ